MTNLEQRNQKIIDAIIEKAKVVCPGSLAMIGVYGSFMTGDIHAKSDLDLLILINDDRGWQLGCTFIQDDLQVGHDIYCTTWESLQNDARYEHPNISKLMDSRIVYCADEKYAGQLEVLRKQVNDMLSAPFSEEDYKKAENMLKEAEHYYTMALISEKRSEVLEWTGYAIYFVENAIAMLNKQYFHYGTRRTYEELDSMKNRPERLSETIESVITAATVEDVKQQLSLLMRQVAASFQEVREPLAAQKRPGTEETLRGTYEEMYSNWRNKMYVAAETGDRHLAFMSMVSLKAMLSEIRREADIGRYDVFAGYDSGDLPKTAKAYDTVMNEYLQMYHRAGIQKKHYSDIDAFVRDYLVNAAAGEET